MPRESEGDMSNHDATFAWGNFGRWVFYGYANWPSYSYWLVPGTITDEERVGWR